MKRTPVDRVRLQLPAERRLAATLRAVVLIQARSFGFTLAEAAPLAKAVTQKFRTSVEESRVRSSRALNVVFEQCPDELRVLFQPGPGRRAATFRARRKPPRLSRKLRNHPSV